MITQKRVLGLVGAGALLMGMMLGTTSIAAAASGTVDWTGNGVTDGVLNSEQCDDNNTPYLFWVLSPADNISAAELWINGVDQGAMQAASDHGNAAFQLQTAFFDLDTLTASAAITTTGDTAKGLKLKISHGCAGTFSSTVESSTASSSSTTSFSSTVESTTDTLPPTDTIGSTSNGQQSSGLWLLIAGLGVLLGSAIVLAPAKAKTKR
jgi:hypothetical protein